jgi:hypothetical protein
MRFSYFYYFSVKIVFFSLIFFEISLDSQYFIIFSIRGYDLKITKIPPGITEHNFKRLSPNYLQCSSLNPSYEKSKDLCKNTLKFYFVFMTWLFSNLTGNSIFSSQAQDENGVNVPEVKIIYLMPFSFNLLNDIAGSKHYIFRPKKCLS